MKVLLVTSPQDGLYKNKMKKFVRGLLPPLGVGYIAAVLEKDGHSVKIIDSPALGYDIDDIIDFANMYKPDILGISAMSPAINETQELAEKFRHRFSDTKIILGGPHVTCFPMESMILMPQVDIAVIGEGEDIILNILNALKFKESLSPIKGIYYRDNSGNIIKTSDRCRDVDLESLPYPARHLYSIYRYMPEPFENKKIPSTNIIASRGCTYAKCTFCYRSGRMKRNYRVQSPYKTLNEVRYLVKTYKMEELVFYDDDLLSNKRWVIEFCKLLIREPYRLSWSFRGRCDTADYEALKLAKEAGCWSVTYGFESGNQDLLDNVKKGITLDQSRRAAQWAHKLGLELVGTFMLGLPGETPQKGKNTINFAIEIDCTYAAFIPVHPFIGTQLHQDASDMGKFIDKPYTKKMKAIRFIPSISYVPDGYRDSKELERMCKCAYRKFYLRPSYIYKHIKRMRNFEDIKRYIDGAIFVLGVT